MRPDMDFDPRNCPSILRLDMTSLCVWYKTVVPIHNPAGKLRSFLDQRPSLAAL